MNDNVKKQIEDDITQNKILVYMKGSPDSPQCGFSKTVVDILALHDAEFKHVNILDEPEVRQGVKEYTDWPTIPQVFINGEFIGGCDVVLDLHNNGELDKILSAVKK